MFSIYNTASWLTDSRALVVMPEDDLDWMFDTIIKQAKKNGLERTAPILNEHDIPKKLFGLPATKK